jgi:hypothetical protein
VFGLCIAGAGALAVVWATSGPLLRWKLRIAASGLRARAVDSALRVYDPFGAPTTASCNCSSDWEYRCSDPSSAYSEKIRRDPRLAELFIEPANRLETYARHQNFLRDQVAHGAPRKPGSTEGYDVLAMLDDAATGSRFLCGDIVKMFVEIVQANGGFARVVDLIGPDASGHVVAEAWVEEFHKWVVFDPDYNVHYTDRDGTPLGALDLHEIHRSGRYDRVVAHEGASANSLYRPAGHEPLLRHYESIAFNRRADFADVTYPSWHPGRHAVTNLTAWATDQTVYPAVAVHDLSSDASQLYFTPCRDRRPNAASAGGD